MKIFFALLAMMLSVTGYAQAYKCEVDGRPKYTYKPCEAGQELKKDDRPTIRPDFDIAGVKLGTKESEIIQIISSTLGINETEIELRSKNVIGIDVEKYKDMLYALKQSSFYHVNYDGMRYGFALFPDMDNPDNPERVVGRMSISFDFGGEKKNIELTKKGDEAAIEYAVKKYGKPTEWRTNRKGEQYLFWCPGYENTNVKEGGRICPFHSNNPIIRVTPGSGFTIYDERYVALLNSHGK